MIQLVVVLDVGLLLAALEFVQRRLRDVDVPALDELGHLAIEEREQQCADVASVDIRIAHDDHAVIAELGDVEIVLADAGTERRDQRADLGRRQHLVEARPLDIQDLALERQDRLRAPVAALLGGAAGGVALDDEDLGQRRVFLLTVGELAREPRDIERALAPRHLARLSRRLARARRFDHLGDDEARLLRVLEEKFLQLRADRGLDHALHLGGDQLVLGLRGELGIRQLHRQDRGEALARIVAGHRHLVFPRQFLLDVVVERARQSAAKPGEMRAAVLLRNVVGVAEHALLVGVVPLQRHLHRHRPVLRAKPDHRLVDRRARAVHVLHERLQSAGVREHVRAVLALVDELDANAGVQERELAQPFREDVVVELDVGEDLRARPEADDRTAIWRLADRGERRRGLAEVIFLAVELAVAGDGELQVVREGVDDRHADPVQPARDLVGAVVELPPRVQHRHDHFSRRAPLLGVDIHRDPAAVIGDGHGFIGVDGDHDTVTMAGQGLVDGVIDDLENHVVQPRAVIGITDVHPGAFPHRIKTF